MGPLVLLVDDDPDLLELSELVLSRNGLRVATARNGRQALTALDYIQPDVIVTDVMMPELDGLTFLERYAKRPEPRAPVVAVSAFHPYLEQASALGASATLGKPYDPKTLASLIHDVASGRATPAPEPGPIQSEDARLQAVTDLQLEHPSGEMRLQPFLDDVASLYGVPVAGISAVTADRQRLVERCSSAPDDPGGPREDSFCTHAVAARAALVVQDARRNPFFRDNPSVTERGFCFYAGVPLMAPHGEAVGTLCLLDFAPRRFSYFDLELLGLLARRVRATLEGREATARHGAHDCAFRDVQGVDGELDIFGKSIFADLIVVQSSRGMEQDEPAVLVGVVAPRDRLRRIVDELRRGAPGSMCGRLGPDRIGWMVLGQPIAEVRRIARRAAGPDAQIVATTLDRYEGAMGLALLHVEEALDRSHLA
ncbi:MAG: response regulator [Myxococcota bacterium]